MNRGKINGWQNVLLGGIAFLAGVAIFLPSFAFAAAGKAVTNISGGGAAEFDVEGDLTCGIGGFLKDDWSPQLTIPYSCPPGSASVFSGTGTTEPPPATPSPNLTSARFQDKAKSSLDNIYAGGSKQNNTNTWIEAIGSAPVKTDFGNVYSAARQGYLQPNLLPAGWVPASSSNVIAFMGFERLSANGDTHLDYELNQLPFVTNANGALVPQRCSYNGQVISGLTCLGPDLLIGVDDGTSKVPTITAYHWVGDGTVGVSQSPSSGKFVAVSTPVSPFTFNLGATNSASTPPGPWGTYNKQGKLVFGTNLIADTFSEVAVDLTVLTGLTIDCPGQFKSIFIKSRSSSEVNSELKDRTAPQAFGLDTCGSMKITKQDASDPNNITPLAGAVFTITPDPATGAGFVTVTSDANGIVYDSTQVKPGVYTIHEVSSPLGNVPPADQICDLSAFKATCTLVIDNVGLQHLTAVKLANPTDGSSVVSGQTITYTINYSNDGTAPALNTVITDVVDLNLTNVVPSAGGVFNASTRTVTWNVGNVGIGVTGSVSFSARVVSPLSNVTILNKAHLINDRDLAGFDTNVVMYHVGGPNFTLSKSVDKTVASPSATLTYTLTYANTGQGDATAVVITDVLPARTTYLSSTGGGTYNASTNTVTWTIGTVLHGGSGSVTFTVTLDPVFPNGETAVKNAAVISSTEVPPTPSNEVVTHVNAAPNMSLVKAVDRTTAKPSESLVYTLTYRNDGNADAMNVTISDVLPAKTTFVSATSGGTYAASTNTVSFTIGTVQALGGTGFVSFTVKPDPVFPNGETAVKNAAVLSLAESPMPVPSNEVTTTVTAAPMMSLMKAVDKTSAAPSDLLVYTLTYRNDGDADATNVTLSDTLPAKTTFVSATGGGIYTAATNTVTWTVGTVPALGGAGVVTFTVKLDPVFPHGTTAVKNAAVLSFAEGSAPVLSNEVTTLVTASVNLSISKLLTASVNRTISNFINTATITSREDTIGQTGTHVTLSQLSGVDLTYTISYSNTGNADASSITITDVLPAESCFIAASGGGSYGSIGGTVTTECPTGFKGGTVTWIIPALASQASSSFTVDVRVGF